MFKTNLLKTGTRTSISLVCDFIVLYLFVVEACLPKWKHATKKDENEDKNEDMIY